MNKNKILNLGQRVLIALIYIIIFIGIARIFSHNFTFLFDSQNNYNQLFVSVALLLIFGAYIAEPFFSKPTDVLVNASSIFLFLLSVNDPSKFIGYYFIATASAILIILSIGLILSTFIWKKTKWQDFFLEVLVYLGQSKVAFSVIYIASLVSYFKDTPIAFSFFFTFWVIFITGFILEEFILKITDFLQHFFGEDKNISYVGQAIGYENPFVFKVEVDINKTKAHIIKGDLVRISLKGEYDVFGVVVDQKILLNKKWLTVYLLRDQDNFIHATSLQIPSHKTLFQTNYSVNKVSLENLGESLKETIAGNPLYENRSKFIGYIEQGSDINCIKFYILPGIMEEPVVEGSVVSSSINGKNVLFQVINGNTQEESLEHHNNHSFISVTARKIGEYDELKKEIISARWLPEMYMPVFSLKNESYLLEEGNKTSVGSLPNTPYSIEIKNFNELVTHNTAILGILGIGKSCLTFELIQKVILNTTAKIICIDITNEYKKELVNYFDKSLIKEELSSDSLKELKDNNKTGVEGDPSTWGNEVLYKTKLDAELATFSSDTTSRVLILNPDLHSVSKAGSSFKIQHKTDLTVSEKTRTISERVFMNAKKQWDILTEEVRDKSEAQFLIVFEEAHSLIPEWNSTANSGDQSASNGTAKVILQGRKYGLGSFVVTQRTANISKSILNQCNTIFALRVFDDTGKQFLENYIGSDYASTLPTLEERHAITIGKALKLKQPIIISLNDKKIIIKSKETSN